MRSWKPENPPHPPSLEPSAAGVGGALASTAAEPNEVTERLQAARGDDEALLALLRERLPLEAKLAAVAALAGETALKLAEAEFRGHDRRVHRLAKQRYTLVVAQRKARAQARAVIDEAKGLAQEPSIPVNRLVEIDRAWNTLEPGLLDAAQRGEYEAVMAHLAALARERADQPQKHRQWSAQAREALAELNKACAEAAAGLRDRSEVAAAGAAARAVIDTAAPELQGSPVLEDLGRAVALSGRLDERLARLDEVLGFVPEGVPRPPADEPEAAASAAGSASQVDAALRFARLEALGDAALDELLQQRFAHWQQAQEEARAARRGARREQARSRQQALRDEQARELAALLDLAENALAAGQLAPTHAHLIEIDRRAGGGAPPAALRERIDTLQARYAQLQGWQHWAGGRARDELVLQAEALAADPRGAGGVKLTTRQLAELIDEMRARWKELDRLGGATSRTLWQRFETALKAAYKPVSDQLAVQRAAREQNLQARMQLLDPLEAVPLPNAADGAAPPDWRPLATALDQFRAAWRRLGPVEHTVPHGARTGLLARVDAATQRLEAPLHEAWRGARLEREELVARAKALQAEAPGRDLVARARELQAQWQQHAHARPLARADEQALWVEFKTAVDAAFRAREAAFDARDAEFRAHGAERVALIERLEALDADTPVAQLERTLRDVDAQWWRAGPAPRSDAAALEARFHRARDQALRWVATSAQRGWQAVCDALAAKLALCVEVECSVDPTAARLEIDSRWSALPALPQPLETALAERAGLAAPGAREREKPIAASSDEWLLRLEEAWGLQSPPAHEAARRALKLQAMKAALETRRPTAKPVAPAGPATPLQWLVELLRRPLPDAAQRERLDALVSALRRRGSLDKA